MVNRDRHDITIEILKKSTSGKKKTELMNDIGLSYSQAQQYLTRLIENGLLEVDERNRFKTTKKGFEFVQKCGDCWLFRWDKQKR